MYDLRRKRVWVPGHRGMVGGAILRRLREEDCTVLTASRDELDLTRQNAVEEWVGKAVRRKSEEHTSELQSLMRISYAVLCLKKKTVLKTVILLTYYSL